MPAGNAESLPSIAVAIVIFHPDRVWLKRTLDSLGLALQCALDQKVIAAATVRLVDNAGDSVNSEWRELFENSMVPFASTIATELISGHGNIGYGAACNLAFRREAAELLLVLNPDVLINRDALANAVQYLLEHSNVVMISPVASALDGAPQYLAKRFPGVLSLAVRGFAPSWLKAYFAKRLQNYERAEVPFDEMLCDLKIVSGCFMLMRGSGFRLSAGFDESFFLYFEDFDLSYRMSRIGQIVRLPACRIVHGGGDASRKGAKHIVLFARSAVRFFGKHGWRW